MWPPASARSLLRSPHPWKSLTTQHASAMRCFLRLIAGPNTVVVTAVDFDRPQNTTTASMDFTFSVRPPATLDVFPTAIDLVQSITLGHTLTDQDVIPGRPGYDFDVARFFGETPYLLAGKPTVIRVYGAASGMSTMPAGVPATMVVERDSCSGTILECGISGGVFVPPMKNFTTPQITGITVPLAASGSTPTLMRPDLKNTWNFLLPGDWTTQGDLRVTITINNGFYLNFGNTPSVLE